MVNKLIIGCLVMIMAAISWGCGSPNGKQQIASQTTLNKDIILATTTSTQDSGLLDVLLPVFEQKTGYKVKTVAVGTGQALAMGEKGEADVLFVHAPDAEKKVLSSGAVKNRLLVMHNDFVIVGPTRDTAGIKGKTTMAAITAIAGQGGIFVSRGDDSGTHKMEKKLWQLASITPASPWYQDAGAGMGQTLRIADEKQGYTITDRATYLAQKKNLSLQILVEGDVKLLNIYHVMAVNPEKFSKVNQHGAKAFSDFLLSAEGQGIITAYGKDKFGEALFFADGGKTEQEFGF